MNEEKSTFLKLDEATGLISQYGHLNKGFVKKEIFTIEKLKELGFDFQENDFKSKHSVNDSMFILEDISNKIQNKQIDTRKNRGQIVAVLEKESKDIINNNENNSLDVIEIKGVAKATVNTPIPSIPSKRKSARTKSKQPELFNGTLYLNSGQISDLYRDIADLYSYYITNKATCSQYFPSLIRMSLRLLAEAAASDKKLTLDKYIKNNFQNAKGKMTNDDRTTLSTQNVNENTIIQLLHIGAHNYSAANNLDQTIAISLLLGNILTLTHGR